jgi:hypothetical protein
VVRVQQKHREGVEPAPRQERLLLGDLERVTDQGRWPERQRGATKARTPSPSTRGTSCPARPPAHDGRAGYSGELKSGVDY